MNLNNEIKLKISKLQKEYFILTQKNPNALYEIDMSEIPEIVYNSNAIENSTLTLEETESIIFFEKIKKDHEIREIFEAKNLAKVIERVHVDIKSPISVNLILKLHKILLSNINDHIAGRFRSGDEWVRVGSHLGANPFFVNGFVYDLVDKYNKDKKSYFLDKIAYFHAEFENIHPFLDGNGRIGRVLINKQLEELGYPPIIIPHKNKHKDYYPLFNNYLVSNKIDGFVKLFALLLMESLHKRISTIRGDKIISLNIRAKQNHKNVNSYLNKAKRQTIPAFRICGKWMINSEYID